MLLSSRTCLNVSLGRIQDIIPPGQNPPGHNPPRTKSPPDGIPENVVGQNSPGQNPPDVSFSRGILSEWDFVQGILSGGIMSGGILSVSPLGQTRTWRDVSLSRSIDLQVQTVGPRARCATDLDDLNGMCVTACNRCWISSVRNALLSLFNERHC